MTEKQQEFDSLAADWQSILDMSALRRRVGSLQFILDHLPEDEIEDRAAVLDEIKASIAW